MKTMLLENTLQIVLLGVLLTTLFGAFWWHTRKGALLLVTLAMILLTAGALVVERLVETDRESAVSTIYEIAAAVGKKSIDELMDYVHPSAPWIGENARAEINRYELTSARVTQIWDVEVNNDVSPPQAIVRCNVAVTGSAPAIGIAEQDVVRYVVVTLARDGQRWKVLSYEHAPPQRALQQHRTP